MLRSRNSDGIFSFYFRMAITAPIAPLQTPVQKAHLKAIVNRCQKILFLFIFRFVKNNMLDIESIPYLTCIYYLADLTAL